MEIHPLCVVNVTRGPPCVARGPIPYESRGVMHEINRPHQVLKFAQLTSVRAEMRGKFATRQAPPSATTTLLVSSDDGRGSPAGSSDLTPTPTTLQIPLPAVGVRVQTRESSPTMVHRRVCNDPPITIWRLVVASLMLHTESGSSLPEADETGRAERRYYLVPTSIPPSA